MESPTTYLARIAARSASTWLALGDRMFPGEATIETGHRLYVFRNGRFVSRTTKTTRSFEAPASMRGLRLIGFVFDDGGVWALSSRYRPGCHAAMWRPAAGGPGSFILTSRVVDLSIEDLRAEPQIVRSPFASIPPSSSLSGVRTRKIPPAPAVVRPAPPSMTRLHASQTVAPASHSH